MSLTAFPVLSQALSHISFTDTMAFDYKNTSPRVESPTAFERNSHVNSTDHRRIDPESGVKRGLKTRHLSMLALAGIIGPGLLVGAGGALSNGGPASLIIGFGVIGIIAFSIMQSLGELTTLYPSGGAFTSLADRFVDKAFGVAVGWNYWIIWVAVRQRCQRKNGEH
jgi:yeast amino acid transporter